MRAIFDRTKHTKYYIDKSGRVYMKSTYRNQSGKLENKKATKHKRGYYYVRTANGNYQVHRLVATAFIPNPNNKPCVNHKDGDKSNNDISNLEWVTHKENTRHGIESGLIRLAGKNEGNLKYTNEQCKDVISRVKNGMTYLVAGAKYNMPYSTVAHLIRGSRRRI